MWTWQKCSIYRCCQLPELYSVNGGLRRHVYGTLFVSYRQEKTHVLWEKPLPLPVCPPEIPQGLAWDWKPGSAVRARPLTAQVRTRPCQQLRRKAANTLTAQQCNREVLHYGYLGLLLLLVPQETFLTKNAWPSFSTADHKQSHVHIRFTANQWHTNRLNISNSGIHHSVPKNSMTD
jgi:hypothetical protein